MDAWAPAPENISEIVSIDSLDDDEEIEISFKRVMMTDAEFDNLPEG